MVDLDHPHLQPLHDVVSTLVYSARGSDVDMTIVGGEVVYRDGHCVRVDEDAAVPHAQERAESLLLRAGIDKPRTRSTG